MSIGENREILLRCIDSYNLCTMDWLNTYYSKTVEWISMPTQMDPNGRKGGFKEFWDASERFLQLVPNRKLRVISSVCENDIVILEQELKGNFARDGGSFKAGAESSAIVVSFFTIKDSLIIRHKDYCVRNVMGLT